MIKGSRMMMKRGAPTPPPGPYDSLVEWLSTTGGEPYIMTDIPSRDNLLVTTKLLYDWSSNVTHGIFSGFPDGRVRGLGLALGFNSSVKAVRTNYYAVTASWTNVPDIDTSNPHIIIVNSTSGNKYVEIDGVKIKTATSTTSGTGSNISLFRWYNNSTKFYSGSVRIYSFSITDTMTGTELISLHPCRIGTTGYMYDSISCKLCETLGTGSFAIGPDKS